MWPCSHDGAIVAYDLSQSDMHLDIILREALLPTISSTVTAMADQPHCGVKAA